MRGKWKVFGQSRLKMAMASGVILTLAALFTAGVSLAPMASASTASAQAASVNPETTKGPYYGGSYSTLKECNDNLNEIKTSPSYAGGYCVLQNGKWVMYYYIYVAACTPVSPGRASRPAAVAPAC
jgi:hypothetical protein